MHNWGEGKFLDGRMEYSACPADEGRSKCRISKGEQLEARRRVNNFRMVAVHSSTLRRIIIYTLRDRTAPHPICSSICSWRGQKCFYIHVQAEHTRWPRVISSPWVGGTNNFTVYVSLRLWSTAKWHWWMRMRYSKFISTFIKRGRNDAVCRLLR